MLRSWRAIRDGRMVVRLPLFVATALVSLLLLAGLALVERYNDRWESRADKMRALTAAAVSMATELERRVQEGAMTREEAIGRFRDILRTIRFEGGVGYFFAYDTSGLTLMLGPTPQADGTGRFGMRDSDGKLRSSRT